MRNELIKALKSMSDEVSLLTNGNIDLSASKQYNFIVDNIEIKKQIIKGVERISINGYDKEYLHKCVASMLIGKELNLGFAKMTKYECSCYLTNFINNIFKE